MSVSYVCLIYKSTKWLKFVYEQFNKHTKLNNGDEFYFVANDACSEVLDYLKHNNIKHYIHNNTEEQKKEWYINNVYRAWNTAAKKANGDYIVFLNSDFAFSPDWNTNLINKITENSCVCSRLVERGILRSGTYGIELNFGNNYDDYNEEAFLNYIELMKENKLYDGGLYMPMLIKKDHMEKIGYYPEGNGKMGCDIFNPIIAKKGEPVIPGDNILIEKLKSIDVKHVTAFDSIIYHFQEGEMRE
jgi:glycosyltransferase involved in cell wall biosynthesis